MIINNLECRNEDLGGDDDGYIVVETIGTFIPFVLLLASILSLVNIVALQSRVHYALTQAANTLSMYSYILEVTGLANSLTTLDNKANRVAVEANAFRNDVSGVIEGIESLSGMGSAATHGGNAANRALGGGEQLVDDPNGVLQLLLNYGLNELRNQLFEELARPLVGRYLANGEMTGNEYLHSVRVVSGGSRAGLEALEFYRGGDLEVGSSVMIDGNGNIILILEYEIEYTFGGLPLPFRPTLNVTQTVVTKAWLNGSGRGYW